MPVGSLESGALDGLAGMSIVAVNANGTLTVRNSTVPEAGSLALADLAVVKRLRI